MEIIIRTDFHRRLISISWKFANRGKLRVWYLENKMKFLDILIAKSKMNTCGLLLTTAVAISSELGH